MKTRSAFTLIELLVVISIIAVLASISLPVYNSVMENSRAATDANNLKQLGTGVAQYLNDNEDQMFSIAGAQIGATAALTPWPVALHDKYITDWKSFRSPFDKVSSDRPNDEKGTVVPVSYGFNPKTLSDPAGANPDYDGHTSKWVSPSKLILMAPATTPTTEIGFKGTSDQNPSLTLPTGGAKRGTHSGRNRINVLTADTHVETLSWKDFADLTSEIGLQRWEPTGKVPGQP